MSGAEYVTFDTNVGQFTVELYTKHAPKVSY
jgi:peptidyl-prolyl cis-trans isomerase-like 1